MTEVKMNRDLHIMKQSDSNFLLGPSKLFQPIMSEIILFEIKSHLKEWTKYIGKDMSVNLSTERFLLPPWLLCTYHSQARSWYLSDFKLIFFSLMSLDNNVYKIWWYKKVHNHKISIQIDISYITLFEFITLLRVNYTLPIDKVKTCCIYLINSEM